jgi:uncharacterized protein (DUF608 family)
MMKIKLFGCIFIIICVLVACDSKNQSNIKFNSTYSGENLNRIAFPMGGIGAGMICLEGNACISHVSVRHKPDVFNQPYMFAALAVKGIENGTKVLEGPVQKRKIFGDRFSGNGSSQTTYGFPRFEKSEFLAGFPFAKVTLKDNDFPMDVIVTGWSPFIPGDEDNSSLPLAGLEYTFTNNTKTTIEAVFSYHSENFMRIPFKNDWGKNYEQEGHRIKKIKNGFVLSQSCLPGKPHYKGEFAIFTRENAVVDHRWFRGGWYDARTQLWKDIEKCDLVSDTTTQGSTNASLYIPIKIESGESKTIHLMMAWNVPHSDQSFGGIKKPTILPDCDSESSCCSEEYASQFYEPWYSSRFKDVYDVSHYWMKQYDVLKSRSEMFSKTFYLSDLPPEVLEAISANLTILKSPTVLRQKDGKLWTFEGCFDSEKGCCYGSCTHVWNYAQAIPHLFPRLERSLRETEFQFSQDEAGHQNFRSSLPVQLTEHGWHAAADGQLGGIMKVYREWRISGDTEWLKSLWPKVKNSFNYCSSLWDPESKGILEEPHHNTYDIEFWGPDGMCTSIYLGALSAMVKMSEAMGEDSQSYKQLLERGQLYMENKLFDGEYFIQKVVWEGLRTPSPLEKLESTWNINYSEEALELLTKEGPKYQYGAGCLSDGIIGTWFDAVCGLPEILDHAKVKSHLISVHKYNFRRDLSNHVNPQRPGYAMGNEGGLLLCSWPKGNQPSLPFVYSNEVWTGIEYQVASHLMMAGEVEKGLDIVREARKRYDGTVRNPFNEYECGHWYARAMSSYALIQGLTGLFYDALESTLYVNSQIGNNFRCFIATENGYGLAGLKNGEPFFDVVYGQVEVKKYINNTIN